MSNPFDRFDADAENPFDELDPPVAPKKPATPKKTTRPRMSPMQQVTGFMANANANFPLADEIAAVGLTAANTLKGAVGLGPQVIKIDPKGGDAGRQGLSQLGAEFGRNMGFQRDVEAQYAREQPKTAALGRGFGMAAGAAIPGGKVLQTPALASRGVNMLRGATTAATTAAAYGLSDRGTPMERVERAKEAAFSPVTLSLGAAGGALVPTAKGAAKPVAPSLDELKSAKNAAYDAVDQSGVRYKPEAFDEMVDGIAVTAKEARINPMIHPKAAAMLDTMQGLKGQSPSLTELDQLRQVIRRDVASASDDAEKFFGTQMIRQLDDFIDAADATKVASGSAEDAAGMITNARDLNTRVRKIGSVNDAVESARLRAGSTGSGGNVDNATRQNLRRVLEDTRNLTPDERAALETIVMGSPGQNFLRQVGKLSPQGNGLMTALSIGGAAANPLLAIPTAAGAVSKVGADAITQKRVADLINLIAMGGSRSDPAVLAAQRELATITQDPAVISLAQKVAAKLGQAAGVAGASASAQRPELSTSTNALSGASR